MDRIEIKAYYARTWISWHYPNSTEGIEFADKFVRSLRETGFATKSKAGVTTYYPSHRIHKITRRIVKGK